MPVLPPEHAVVGCLSGRVGPDVGQLYNSIHPPQPGDTWVLAVLEVFSSMRSTSPLKPNMCRIIPHLSATEYWHTSTADVTRLFLFQSFPEWLCLLFSFLQFLGAFLQQLLLFLGFLQQILTANDDLLLDLSQLLLQHCLLRPNTTSSRNSQVFVCNLYIIGGLSVWPLGVAWMDGRSDDDDVRRPAAGAGEGAARCVA